MIQLSQDSKSINIDIISAWYSLTVLEELPDPFRRLEAWRNSTKAQQSSHA